MTANKLPKDSGGFIAIYRKVKKNWMWAKNFKRPFTEFEAWMDLLLDTAFEYRKRRIKSKIRTENRGELLYSLRYFAERWRWSVKKVDTFLKNLEEDRAVKLVKRKANPISKLIVCNYDVYNPRGDSKGDREGDTKETVERQSSDSRATNRTIKQLDNTTNNIIAILNDQKYVSAVLDAKNIEEWIDKMLKTYPDINHIKEIMKADAWICANPQKQKKNYRQFLNNWFSNTQNKIDDIPKQPALKKPTLKCSKCGKLTHYLTGKEKVCHGCY